VTRSTLVQYRSWDDGGAEPARAFFIRVRPPGTVVSLTFDDAYADQWLYLRPLLRSHHMNATFYVITGDSDRPYACCMSFAQLRTLQSEGDDIGGHGVSHARLTDRSTSHDSKVADVCGSRLDLLAHGIHDPVSYAYPFGSFDSAAERIVQSCGYGNAREGGGVSPSTTTPGSPWAESLPPRDSMALKAADVDAPGAKTLADLESFVRAAVTQGGAWLPLTFHNVCDSSASDYGACMASWSAVDDRVLAQFLDWLQAAGKPGGAPSETTVQTVRDVMDGVTPVST
jgi:peptidoglycan/xylan/chitin deacetylase (PgdA/CDA1 family)